MILSDTIEISDLKRIIWREVGGSWVDGKATGGNNYMLIMAKHNTGYTEPATLYNLEKLLREIRNMKSLKPAAAVVPMRQQYPVKHKQARPTFEPIPKHTQPEQPDIPDAEIKQRYNDAHKMNFITLYPSAYKDGHYTPPVFPKVKTANGLTSYIVNYITWLGMRATRINVSGRLIDKVETQASGAKITIKKMIKSSTRKGSADVSSTINGRSIMWEVKIGRDRPSPEQLKEAARERRSGGEYYFVSSAGQFLGLLDMHLHG